jgi:hypothetical protein
MHHILIGKDFDSKLEVKSMPRKERQQKTFHTHKVKLKMISLSTKGFGT